jgi:hypothetical protein
MNARSRVNVRTAIEATRTARDNAARAAELVDEFGADPLADSLNQLAAKYDELLAQLLGLDKELEGTTGP